MQSNVIAFIVAGSVIGIILVLLTICVCCAAPSPTELGDEENPSPSAQTTTSATSDFIELAMLVLSLADDISDDIGSHHCHCAPSHHC